MTGPTSTAGPLVRFCVGVWEVKIHHISPTEGQNPEISGASSMISPFPYRNFKRTCWGMPTSLSKWADKNPASAHSSGVARKSDCCLRPVPVFSRGWFWDRWLQQKNSVDQRPRENGVGEGNYSGWTRLIHARWETRCFRKKERTVSTPQGFFPSQTLWRE